MCLALQAVPAVLIAAGGDEGFNEEQGRADSQKGPIISEPSSSPTFASDSGGSVVLL